MKNSKKIVKKVWLEILYFLKIKKRGFFRWSPTSAYWGDRNEFIEKKTKKKNN